MVLFLFDGEFITLIDFLMLSQPCTTMINTAWSWSKILFLCSGFGLLVFCWELLHLLSKEPWVYSFFFFSPLWYLCLVLLLGWHCSQRKTWFVKYCSFLFNPHSTLVTWTPTLDERRKSRSWNNMPMMAQPIKWQSQGLNADNSHSWLWPLPAGWTSSYELTRLCSRSQWKRTQLISPLT